MLDGIGPRPPSSVNKGGAVLKPEDWNPEMAAATLAKELINGMGTPAILTQKFVVWHGICKALNHVDPVYIEIKEYTTPPAGRNFIKILDKWYKVEEFGNLTGIDCSFRVALYEHAAKNSVNVNGQYFFEVWKYLNKPKIIVTQPGMMPGGAMEDEQPSLGRRLLNKITGGGNNGQPNNTQ
jgi:hypothetical protein